MATIATTTFATPFQWPSNTLFDRDAAGNLYAWVRETTTTNATLYRSINNGTSWGSFLAMTRTGLAELGSIFVSGSTVHVCYRVDESTSDKVYYRMGNLTTGAWITAEVLVSTLPNGGVAGSAHNGMDITVANYGGSFEYAAIVVAVGSYISPYRSVMLFGVRKSGLSAVADNSVIAGTRWWFDGGTTTGRITPVLDIEHWGDGKGANTPHLWVAFGRSNLRMVKLAWTGTGWVGPTTHVAIANTIGADDYTAARFDGSRFVMAIPDMTEVDKVRVYERDRSNSTTTTRTTPVHPAGTVRNCAVNYNSVNGDLRVYGIGTTTAVLYFVDYVRATGLWTSWGTVAATAVLGTTGQNFGVRRSTYGNARHDVYAAHSGAPNTLTHYAQALSYAPNTPTWVSPVTGAAQDVAVGLVLDWVFSDPDPADTQSAYALSRQIGAGAIQYWRASDSTWQATEQQNTSGSTVVTLPAAWGVGTDANHTYRVKVWDASSTASGYSAALTVVPSTVVDPTLTAPTNASIITTDAVSPAWTVTEQTAYSVWLARAVANDAFGRTVANGWGTADYGGAWTNTGGVAADYAVTSGTGRHSHAAVNTPHETKQATVSASDVDIVIGPISVPAAATGAAIEIEVRARYVDASNFVGGRVFFATGNTIGVNVRQLLAGVETTTGFPTVPGVTGGGPVMLRVQVSGTTLRARAWPTNAAEPATWAVELAVSHLTAGPIAVRSVLSTGNTNTLPYLIQFDGYVAIGEVVYESGSVADATTRLLALPYTLPDLSAWTVGLQTRNVEGLSSNTVRSSFTVDFVEPPTPTLVASVIAASGLIRVVITNPAPGGGQPAFASGELWRRVVGTTGDGDRVRALLAEDATVDDWQVSSGVAYEYRALARGVNGTSVYSAWTA